jgi:glucose-1-phosphate adenylyltransferase
MGSDNYETLEQIKESHLSHSPFMGIGDRCHIRNAIIDKNTCIGDDVQINVGEKLENGDFETYTVQDGIVIVKKRAVIPNGTVI